MLRMMTLVENTSISSEYGCKHGLYNLACISNIITNILCFLVKYSKTSNVYLLFWKLFDKIGVYDFWRSTQAA